MYHMILVPLDGSPVAERALPFAEALARASHGRVVLIRAALGQPSHGPVSPREQDQVVQEAESYLAGVVAHLDPSIAVERAVLYGEAAEAILAEISRTKADLVIMSSHGHSGPGHWVYGTVADRIIRRAAVPILLVPVACERTWPSDRALRILVPLDGSALAEEALGPARELTEGLPATFILLRVIDPARDIGVTAHPYSTALFDHSGALAEARRSLEGIAARLRADGQMVDVQVDVGPAAARIATAAEEQRASVVAMTTHGRGGPSRLVLSTVATGVVQRANVPILLVRPSALRGPEPPREGGISTMGVERLPISVVLTPRELQLLTNSLENTLIATASAGQQTDELQQLLARIRQAALMCESSVN